jgi:hypothetical protein
MTEGLMSSPLAPRCGETETDKIDCLEAFTSDGGGGEEEALEGGGGGEEGEEDEEVFSHCTNGLERHTRTECLEMRVRQPLKRDKCMLQVAGRNALQPASSAGLPHSENSPVLDLL